MMGENLMNQAFHVQNRLALQGPPRIDELMPTIQRKAGLAHTWHNGQRKLGHLPHGIIEERQAAP
jgi:hypothetical protein